MWQCTRHEICASEVVPVGTPITTKGIGGRRFGPEVGSRIVSKLDRSHTPTIFHQCGLYIEVGSTHGRHVNHRTIDQIHNRHICIGID